MRSIGKLFTAFATLADSLLSLASLVDIATGKLRQQLSLDEGHVIEHQPADNATAEIPQLDKAASKRSNGRKTAAV